MQRTYTNGLGKGKKFLVKGWVAKVRDLGNLKFFMLRDREGTLQVTAKKGVVSDGIIKEVSRLGREDCVAVTGRIVSSKQAPGGRELIPDKIEVVAKAQTPLPIDFEGKIESGFDKRFDYRFLDVRNHKVQAIFRVMDRALKHMRESFERNGFIEINTPVIQAAGAEGGSTMFPIIYYNREAFLRQSPQLYKQIMMASGLDRVYEIGPAFRAEKFHTTRHVSEFLSMDFEMAWIDSEEDVMKVLERLVVDTLRGVKKDCKKELELFQAKLKIPEIPFRRIEYEKALGMVNKKGAKLKFGDDFMDVEEKKLGEILAKKGIEWYFVTKFPSQIKPFYIMMDGKYSRGLDLAFKGLEIASGGQREHRYGVLVKVMKAKGLDPHQFKFYLDAFRFGCPSQGGVGYGMERMVQKILGLDNIKEAILFPRTPEKLVP